MANISSTGKKDEITQSAFDGLLLALDPVDRESAGKRYVELRENLHRFFTWRGAAHPGDAADEAINRAARKLDGGEQIADFGAYAFGVARFLILEINRGEEKRRLALAELPEPEPQGEDGDEGRLDCLQSCLTELAADDRAFIIGYYTGERGTKILTRRSLHEATKLSAGAFRMKALRLRSRLEACVQKCLNEQHN